MDRQAIEWASAPGAARYQLGDYRDYEPALSIGFRCRREPNGRPLDPQLLIIGPKTRPYIFHFAAGWETAAVRVKLEWVEPLFGLRPIEHHDAEHDLREVEPSAGWLFDRLVETRSCVEAAGSLARAVASLARGSTGHASVAAGALELVRRTGGGMPVDGIAQVTGTSERHLRRTVRREAGISLKAYARIARLLRAMTAADRTPTPHWARISADCDYCDQSHLVRECRALAGCTPGELHRERRAEAETSNPD